MRSENSLKIEQNDSGQATIFGVPIQEVGSDSLKKDSVYNLTDEIYKTLSSIECSGRSKKKVRYFIDE